MKVLKHIITVSTMACFFSSAASAAPIFWTDWLGDDLDTGVGFEGIGEITTTTSTVNVTYVNENGISFYNSNGGTDFYQNGKAGRDDTISPYTSSEVDNSPTGTDIVALRYAGGQTLTFSEQIANPVFAFVSLNGNGYSFLNQDFNILSVGGEDGNACGYWGCGGVTKNIVDLGGGNFSYELNSTNVGGLEPHGVIQFTGAFDTLDWNSSSSENWNGFTVGIQGTAIEVFPDPTNPVPEPASVLLLGLGLSLFASRRRK